LQFLQIALSTNNHPNHTMKHSEWLRLKAEGDRVVASLRAMGSTAANSHAACLGIFAKAQFLTP
jgi:hypothetical protein